MSLADVEEFNENLLKLINSELFEKASDAEKIDMGHRLLNSEYGAKTGLFGKIKKL